MIKKSNNYRSLYSIFLILCMLSPILTYSEESSVIFNESINDLSIDKSIILVQNTEKVEESTPQSGTLLFPESLIPNNKEEKKCMTVCAAWGEDCTFINRGAGGMTRNCRRTCQQFSEECF